MTAPRALALSDKQLALLQRAAASLPVGERDHFLQSVAAHLTGAPTDDAVIAAINAALDAAAASLKSPAFTKPKHCLGLSKMDQCGLRISITLRD